MEGVLTPEIWIAVAEKTKIPELRRTTRDEPDYDKLMNYRIGILDQHGIKLSDIQKVIGTLPLLDGTKAFLDEPRKIRLRIRPGVEPECLRRHVEGALFRRACGQ